MATTQPSGPRGVPILGNAVQYARDPLGFAERVADEHGPVAALSFPRLDGYFLTEPEDVAHVLVENAQGYRKPDVSRRDLGGLVGESVLLTEGDRWKRQRRLLQPAFYPDRIRAYAPTMLAAIDRVVADWEDGDVVDVHGAMTELTLSVLCAALFDVDAGERAATVREAVADVLERFRPNPRVPITVPEWVPTPANRRYRRGLERLEGVIEDLAAEVDEGGDGSGERALLGTLQAALEDDEISEREFRDNLLAMLLAGHETTATALTAAVYLLATHPEEQRRLAEAASDLDGPPGPDAAVHGVADDVVREAMRLYPPIPWLLRQATEPDEIRGYEVPDGAVVLTSQWVLHRDERFFDDPDAFRPDRWTGDLEERLPDCAYVPFGAGPRNCIGRRFAMQEARLGLATLARRFRFEPVEGTAFDPLATVTLRPDGPVRLRVRTRGEPGRPQSCR